MTSKGRARDRLRSVVAGTDLTSGGSWYAEAIDEQVALILKEGNLTVVQLDMVSSLVEKIIRRCLDADPRQPEFAIVTQCRERMPPGVVYLESPLDK